MANDFEGLTGEQLRTLLIEYLTKEAASVIGLDPGDIGEDDLLWEADGARLGGDSLDRADLAMALEEDFSLDIPSDEIREHFSTVRKIADYLESKGKGVRDVRGL